MFIVGLKKKYIRAGINDRLFDMEHGWFPWPVEKYINAVNTFVWPEKHAFGTTPKRPLDIPIELTVWHALKKPLDATKLANGKEFFQPHSPKFSLIEEGDDSGYSFKRLHRYRYSPTVWYGHQEVHLHPWQPRRLSVREALRLQTVPDEYELPLDISLSAKFQLVCNGVPCQLAKEVAKSFLKLLKKIR